MKTFLSALLIVLAFPHWNLSPLIWGAFVPFLITLAQQKTAGQSLRQGMLLGFWMTMGGFYWVAHSLQNYGGMPVFLSFIGLFFFGLICQPQFPLFAWIFFRVTRRQPHSPPSLRILLGLAGIYTGLDWILPKIFQDTLGHSLYLNSYLRQSADLGGAHLLTFLIIFWNLSLWKSWTIRNAKPMLIPVALLALSLGYGWQKNSQIDLLLAQNPPQVTFAAIQANIGDFDKIAAEQGFREAGFKIMESYLKLSEQALALSPRPQAIIWPETAYPSAFRQPRSSAELERDQWIEKFVRTHQVPLLFGGYDYDPESRKDSNAFFFLHPQPIPMPQGPDQDLRTYRKNILLMFGEYIPGADWFPQIKRWFPQVGYFIRGPGPEVFDIHVQPPHQNSPIKVKAGPIICYEALFPNYILAAARKGSQLILNITNDSWFGRYGEPDLHFSLTVFRSIESRIPQLRATNTGISALVLPNGVIQHQSVVFQEEIVSVQIPLLPKINTLMLLWGDWFGYFAMTVGVLLLGRPLRKHTSA